MTRRSSCLSHPRSRHRGERPANGNTAIAVPAARVPSAPWPRPKSVRPVPRPLAPGRRRQAASPAVTAHTTNTNFALVPTQEPVMTANTPPSTNGEPPRKQLGDQIDRLDGIIDLLPDGASQTMAEATRERARQTVRDVILEQLTGPELRALFAGVPPPLWRPRRQRSLSDPRVPRSGTGCGLKRGDAKSAAVSRRRGCGRPVCSPDGGAAQEGVADRHRRRGAQQRLPARTVASARRGWGPRALRSPFRASYGSSVPSARQAPVASVITKPGSTRATGTGCPAGVGVPETRPGSTSRIRRITPHQFSGSMSQTRAACPGSR